MTVFTEEAWVLIEKKPMRWAMSVLLKCNFYLCTPIKSNMP